MRYNHVAVEKRHVARENVIRSGDQKDMEIYVKEQKHCKRVLQRKKEAF